VVTVASGWLYLRAAWPLLTEPGRD
jgi:hypothetical protein